MKVANSGLSTREKTFSEGNFRGDHQIYRNHSPENIQTVHSEKNQITKNIHLAKPRNYSEFQPVMAVHNESAYYGRISLGVMPHVSHSSLCLLEIGAQPNPAASRYIPIHCLLFIGNKSSKPLKSARKDPF